VDGSEKERQRVVELDQESTKLFKEEERYRKKMVMKIYPPSNKKISTKKKSYGNIKKTIIKYIFI